MFDRPTRSNANAGSGKPFVKEARMGGKGFSTRVNGDTIRKLRLNALLTQKDLAERSGVSRVTISKYESSGSSPSPLSVRKIAKALGADPRDLVTITFD